MNAKADLKQSGAPCTHHANINGAMRLVLNLNYRGLPKTTDWKLVVVMTAAVDVPEGAKTGKKIGIQPKFSVAPKALAGDVGFEPINGALRRWVMTNGWDQYYQAIQTAVNEFLKTASHEPKNYFHPPMIPVGVHAAVANQTTTKKASGKTGEPAKPTKKKVKPDDKADSGKKPAEEPKTGKKTSGK